MIILGIDPSTSCTGYSIFKNKKLIDCGKFALESKFQSERLLQLYEDMNNILKNNKIDIVCVETQFVGKNLKTSLVTPMSKGIVIAMAKKYNCKVIEYPPTSIKKAVTDNGNSKKDKVAEKIIEIFFDNKNVINLGEFCDKQSKKQNKEKNDDIFDAIAIGYSYYILGEVDDDGKSREV